MSTDRMFTYFMSALLLILGLYFLIRGDCHARPPAFLRERQHELERLGRLSIEECVEKIEFHKSEAKRIYDEVKDRLWYAPGLDHRDIAKKIFSILGPAVMVEGVKKKTAAMGLELFIEYGLDCMDEWDWISNKWNWVEYHTDQADFWERYLIHSALLMVDWSPLLEDDNF